MKKLENVAKDKIAELQAEVTPFVTEAAGENGSAPVWNKREVTTEATEETPGTTSTEYVTVFDKPVQASFTKKEKKEQVSYTGYAHGIALRATGERKNGEVKFAQFVLGTFSKVGEDAQVELDVKRTRVTSEDAAFPRTSTVALMNEIAPKPKKERAPRKTKAKAETEESKEEAEA